MNIISLELEGTLHSAFVETRRRRHQTIGVEHLLLALLDDRSALKVFNACSCDIVHLRYSLNQYINNTNSVIEGNDEIDTQPTIEFQKVIKRAVYQVQSVASNIQVSGANVLMALYGEIDSIAVKLLNAHGITRNVVVNYFATGKFEPAPSISEEHKLVKIADELASADSSLSHNIPAQKLRVFISYSHLDKNCLDRLLVHLKPMENQNLIDCWSDKKIKIGEKWKTEVMTNLDNAAVAVLLISADFLASDFIVNQELPPLLLKAETKGLRILPVILKPCGFLRDKALSTIQALNEPTQPLLSLSEIEQEHWYDKIAQEISLEIETRKII